MVIASAGNDKRYTTFYPGSYDGVFSVAWLNNDDTWNGNYDGTVDIGAPGTAVYSTFPDNSYGTSGGSSMSAPVVSAAAALVKMRFPRFTPEQILAQLKATADNTDSVNPTTAGLVGIGRLNMLRAVQTSEAPFLRLADYDVRDQNGNGILEAGERITLTLNVASGQANVGNALVQMRTGLEPSNRYYPIFDDTTRAIAALAANETRVGAATFTLYLPSTLPLDFQLPLIFSFYTADGSSNTSSAASPVLIGRDGISLSANRSYRTLAANNLAVTLNSIGNIGFNDYPSNTQGEGFRLKTNDTTDLLFEGSFIVASGADSISSGVRSSGAVRDRSFLATSLLTLTSAQDNSSLAGKAQFADRNAANDAGVSVEQTATQYTTARQANTLFTSYRITNTSKRAFTGLYAGLFFDWDIGEASTNETWWDDSLQAALAVSTENTALPVIAVRCLVQDPSEQVNFSPLQFADTTEGAIMLDGTFSRSDKYRALSRGIIRTRKQGDVAQMISVGPLRLAAGASTVVNFSITAAPTLDSLRALFAKPNLNGGVLRISPNPASSLAQIDYELTSDGVVKLELVNTLGQLVATLVDAPQTKGVHQVMLPLQALSSAWYAVRLRTANGVVSRALLVAR
jgi:serine protease